MKNKRLVIGLLILAAMVFLLWNALTQPGIADLKGNFKQVAFARSVQNSGPVFRTYVVTVSDTLWKEMNEYGNFMPYNKYGTTKVYFFLNNKPFPKEVAIGSVPFKGIYKLYCVGLYQKDVMSQVSLQKHVF